MRPLDDLQAMVADAPIHILGCENLWIQFARQSGWPEGVTHGGTRVDTSVIALELVASGLGCAMISRELAARHLAGSRVRTLPDLELVHDQAHFLLLPRRTRAASASALVFAKWLFERMNSMAVTGTV
jgi:LysR family glycine cleavage system transcriptional activator